eukprot:2516377-Prymnesium_polylepis.1
MHCSGRPVGKHGDLESIRVSRSRSRPRPAQAVRSRPVRRKEGTAVSEYYGAGCRLGPLLGQWLRGVSLSVGAERFLSLGKYSPSPRVWGPGPQTENKNRPLHSRRHAPQAKL